MKLAHVTDADICVVTGKWSTLDKKMTVLSVFLTVLMTTENNVILLAKCHFKQNGIILGAAHLFSFKSHL